MEYDVIIIVGFTCSLQHDKVAVELLVFQVDIIKTVALPLMKKFVVDDEGLDLKVL